MIARAMLCAVLAFVLATPSASAQFTRPVGDERLSALAERYFAEQWRLNPVDATQAGVHDDDSRLGSYDEASYAQRLAAARHALDDLNTIDPATMGAQASYDARMLQAHLEATILTLASLEPWKHRPSSYTTIAAESIYALVVRDFAPLSERLRSLIARERQIPAMLATALTNLTSVDSITAQIDRGEIEGTIAYFSASVPAAVGPVKDAGLRAEFAVANAAVVVALHTYLAALDNGLFAHPSGTFGIGAQRFATLLDLQELTAIPLQRYESLGEGALERTRAEFEAIAKEIDPTKTPAEIAADLGSHHPAAAGLLEKARADLSALRVFVATHHLVTLPPDDDVKVVWTPEFARETTFASLDFPGPLETMTTQVYYNVTPVERDWNPGRQEQYLSFFNDDFFPLISADEVMPGNEVHFALARHENLSSIRQLLPSPSFAEGWAHYVEQMIVDEGWGGGDPKVRLAQLQGALVSECRSLVSLREHTQGLDIDDATKFFETNAFMAYEPAQREALRGAIDPLYGSSLLSTLEVLKLRDDDKKSMGSAYTLETFHDRLLSAGDPPIAIVRKIILGADDDGNVL